MLERIKNIGLEGFKVGLRILLALLIIFNIKNYNLVVYLFLILEFIR